MMTQTLTSATIRAAGPDDAQTIYGLVVKLAQYEQLETSVVADTDSLREALNGERPLLEAALIEDGDEAIGFATWFITFSTFAGKPKLYIEDLFVLPTQRGEGHGFAMMKYLAAEALARGCARMEWSVLDWNAPARAFYHRVHAKRTLRWLPYGMDRQALKELVD